MPCATITINDTGEEKTPEPPEPPEPEDTDYYLILAGIALIIILMFKR